MKASLTFGLVALSSFASGQRNPPLRVVGGVEVYPAFKYPWLVSLDFLGMHKCGGVIYREDTIITAAHCTYFEGDEEDWTVSYHRHNLTRTDTEEQGTTFNVIKKLNHPDYDGDKFDLNDVALWKIDGKFDIPKSQYVQLDDGKLANSVNTMLTTVGWGATKWGGKASNILLEVKVPTYNIDRCVSQLANVSKIVNSTVMFCAGYPEGNRDACLGDSGGPIFKQTGDKAIVAGLVSWGHYCALPEFPGIYTRLYKFKSFVDQLI